ncbi:(2Fe-2S)-binding protein [Halobacillus shinanisalinarum]|uniref:(2Fe-2S)-binding protein n=1 Tax=Halobacillus shinanisalinarum TaxID=2932258 RepID=A0ABY4H1W0_9BACI|nr:(2Fe-2S)-binding protein [Halobacillus shinanisalinarum]UOQ93905.1 (2Fe-2S)-binding protein [Halobacillus shinanisalinarum]
MLFGDTREASNLLDTIIKQRVVADRDKDSLLVSTDPGDSFVASLPIEEHICTCNSVSKGSIISAVQQEKLSTVDEVRQYTKASSSCGGCKPAVSELLAYIQSDHFDEVVEQIAFCDCTTLTEEEVVWQIQMRSLVNAQEVREKLEWENKAGCPTCRPALGYYLSMIYPDYNQENEGLLFEERMRAATQSNGTLTVVPQFYGGILDTKKLRKITNVTEKYALNQIAIASDQRIHLLGVRQDELSGLLDDLNMPIRSSGESLVEPIQTNICEYACQCDQSLIMASELDEKMEFLKTPFRIKVAISACEHNGAESMTKDIGVIKVKRGWEMYVGGSNEANVRSGNLLCVVSTEQETCEMITGFIQYYRESANYLERIWQWMNRVGLIHIREALFDEEIREHLLKNFDADRSRKKAI